MLSGHIWELQDQNLEHSIQWSIQGKAPPYNPITKKCYLCLKEKHFILYRKENASLNKRGEVYNTCRHRTKTLLVNLKTLSKFVCFSFPVLKLFMFMFIFVFVCTTV